MAMIVNAEQPDLETSKQALTRKQNEFKVTLAQLEDRLLFELSNADPELILGNTALVESLEETKRTAKEIHEQVKKNTHYVPTTRVAAIHAVCFDLYNQVQVAPYNYLLACRYHLGNV